MYPHLDNTHRKRRKIFNHKCAVHPRIKMKGLNKLLILMFLDPDGLLGSQRI